MGTKEQRVSFKIKELRGIELASNIVERVVRITTTQYPILKRDKMISPNKIQTLSADDLFELEEIITPMDQMGLYRELVRFGVPIDSIKEYMRENQSSISFDPKGTSNVVYIDAQLISDLGNNKHMLTLDLGSAMLNANLFMQPELKELKDRSIWREILRERLFKPSFIQKAKTVSQNQATNDQIQKVRDSLNTSIDNPQTQFIARGATISAVGPGQTFPVVEFTIGNNLENDILFAISKKLHILLLENLVAAKILPYEYRAYCLQSIKQTEKQLTNSRLIKNLGDQERLLELYINSDIPNFILAPGLIQNGSILNYPD